MSREIPMLFKGAMVRAILRDAEPKVMTRRVVKKENPPSEGLVWAECLCREIDPSDTPCVTCCARFDPVQFEPGDRIWVKETWNKEGGAVTYRADGDWIADYAAGDSKGYAMRKARNLHPKWKPSIFMPRDYSRITLCVAVVRVERLNDISESDARAEGAVHALNELEGLAHERACDKWAAFTRRTDPASRTATARGAFAMLWESINGEGSWAANPHVRVIGFRRVEQAPKADKATP